MFERPSWLWIVQVSRRERSLSSVSTSFSKIELQAIQNPKFQAIQTPAAQLQAADSEARNGSACMTPFDFVCLIFIKRAGQVNVIRCDSMWLDDLSYLFLSVLFCCAFTCHGITSTCRIKKFFVLLLLHCFALGPSTHRNRVTELHLWFA